MPRERTLFDDFDQQPKLPSSDVPFDAALLALDAVQGLGHKGLQILVGHLDENLGAVFHLEYEEIKTLFADLRISNLSKVAGIITDTSKELLRSANECLDAFESKDIKIISPSNLPQRFLDLDTEAPKWLFVQGNEKLLEQSPTVAVVGTRKPSEAGRRATNAISYVISSYPVVLVSGLADGIDADAHTTTLNRGLKNVAFLGHGINLVFPEQTSGIRAEIIRQGGAVVSEYMPNQSYKKHQFIERNRLQAALADIVIPVEAAVSSGTAHTARFARKYGRRIIGVTWNEANGIVDELAKEGNQIIHILTAGGQKELDAVIRKLVDEYGKSAYPFQTLERHIAREMKGRMFHPEDVTKLTEAIQRLGQEDSSDG